MHCRLNKNSETLLLPMLLLLLLLTSEIRAFGRPRSHKQQHNSRNSLQSKIDCDNSHESILNISSTDKSVESTITDLDPHYNNCGLVGFGFVQKIPYQSPPHSGYSTLDVNFSSACMRCGICIAIVERINQSLTDAHDIMYSDQWLDQSETHLFLKAICDHEFKHYSLREINGERYIGDMNNVPGSIPVASNVDEHWESTLRNKCHDILDDVGTQELYKHWRDWCNDETTAKPLVDILCRSPDSGRLRDCLNINDNSKKFPTTDLCYQGFDWRARVKLSTELNTPNDKEFNRRHENS